MTKCKHYASAALQAQYGGQDCNTIVVKPPVTPTHEGTLPFTGFDVGFFLLIAVILVAAGIVLRRAGRKPA